MSAVGARLGDRLRRQPLRLRLVAGFAVAMLLVLSLAGGFVYWRVEYALDRGLDADLERASTAIAPLVGPQGRVAQTTAADATGLPWQVLDPSGLVLAAGTGAPTEPLVEAGRLPDSGSRLIDVGPLLPADAAAARLRLTDLGEGRWLVVAVRRDHRDEALRELLVQLLVAGLACLVVSCVVGDRLARAALVPVERYRRRAGEIAAGATERRLEVPERRDDEVVRLGHTLNAMLEALDEALARERRFVQDASHELRTPLTLLTSRLQLAQRRTRSVTEHEQVLDELTTDVARLTALAEHLLTPETDRGPVAARPLDLAGLVRRLAPEAVRSGAEDPILVAGTPEDHERMLANLLRNAELHGAPPVRVTLDVVDGLARLVVSDAGPGMPADLLARATERFHRAPEARSRPGSGLGLAIVADLVRRVDGELRLCAGGLHHVAVPRPGSSPACAHASGTHVTVLLPLLEDAVTSPSRG